MNESKEKYLKLLRSPKWRRKALQILKRDNYQCTVCGSGEILEVHHTFYYDNYPDPWKYPNESLITICHNCHSNYHLANKSIIKPAIKGVVKKLEIKVLDKNLQKYFRVECLSHTKKSYGFRFMYADSKEEVRKKMGKLNITVFSIKQVKTPRKVA